MLRPDVEVALGSCGPQAEEIVVLEEGVDTAKSETQEDPRREAAATLAGHQYIGAGGTLGIDKGSVLLHNQLAAQRNHEEHAEPAAEQSQREDAACLKIEAEEDECGQREDDARCDGLACISRRLHDVVLEDAGPAERPEDGNGQYGDRNAGRNSQSGLYADVDCHRAKDYSEERA